MAVPQPPQTEDVESGLPRHYVRPCILLMLAEGPSHGYEMLEQIRKLGVRGTDPGGLYRSLRAMEKEDLVNSWWEPSQSGPARRSYVLTDAGYEAMRTSVGSLRGVQRLLTSLLDRFDSLLGPVSTATVGTAAVGTAAVGTAAADSDADDLVPAPATTARTAASSTRAAP